MSDNKLHYVKYNKCVCKHRITNSFTDCNGENWYIDEKCERYIKHIEIQLTNVTENNANYVTSLQKQLTDMQKQFTDMRKQIIDLENAIKYAPNSEVYNVCKNEFEQLKQ
jgi:hypothetical protein